MSAQVIAAQSVSQRARRPARKLTMPMRREAQRAFDGSAGARVEPSTHVAQGRSAVHWLSLAAVWLAIASSGIVFAEPAPVDLLTMGLIILLPAVGLIAITTPLVWFLAAWLLVAACGFWASGSASDMHGSTVFTAISLYLYIATFVFAAFIAVNPVAHTKLILNAWLAAALVAAIAALAGYFNAFPGAYDLFTKFGRAAGTFKDPNVFGPFVVAPLLYMLHLIVTRPLGKTAMPMIAAGILALALLLSFSRGAWFNLALSVAVFGYLAFALAASAGQRARITLFLLTGVALLATVVAVAVQFESISGLLSERAQLTQSYDVGPEGRFGGQAKAMDLILRHPEGLGGKEFAANYHHEEPHNVYLNMFLNAGWLGGLLFIALVSASVLLGVRHLLFATESRPLFIVVFSAFLATALQGFIIDSDHWRHFYLLMGLQWGLMAAHWRDLASRSVNVAGGALSRSTGPALALRANR